MQMQLGEDFGCRDRAAEAMLELQSFCLTQLLLRSHTNGSSLIACETEGVNKIMNNDKSDYLKTSVGKKLS